MFFAINRLCSDELSLLHIMTRYDSDHMNNGHVHDLAGARLSTRETGNRLMLILIYLLIITKQWFVLGIVYACSHFFVKYILILIPVEMGSCA